MELFGFTVYLVFQLGVNVTRKIVWVKLLVAPLPSLLNA
jgi:hypothetical protein